MTGETPLLRAKNFAAPSVFLPENLLREARRQKGHPAGEIPNVCVLDPDGDIVRQLRADGSGRLSPHWACYHTDLYVTEHRGQRVGVVGCAVGASLLGVALVGTGPSTILTPKSRTKLSDLRRRR